MTDDDKRRRVARFIVDEALAAGCRLGTNGEELLYISPKGMPRDVATQFTSVLGQYRHEVIAELQTRTPS